MFHIEFRTISRLGLVYPTHSMRVGAHIATNREEAARYAASRLGSNAEILSVVYAPVGALA